MVMTLNNIVMHGYGIKYCVHNHALLMVMTLNNFAITKCGYGIKYYRRVNFLFSF